MIKKILGEGKDIFFPKNLESIEFLDLFECLLREMDESYLLGVDFYERNNSKEKNSLEAMMHIYKTKGKTNICFSVPRETTLLGIKLSCPNPRTFGYKSRVFKEVREYVESYFSEQQL